MRPITAMLIVRNEESFIERALQSVMWCDEIVVVDALSHDCTPLLCQGKDQPWVNKMRFYQQEWLGFSAQRNFAISKSTHPWIFFLDADEACSPELAVKIQSLLADPALTPAQYKVRRQEFFLKKPIYHGIWNPSFHVRLFYKDGFEFTGAVHEGVKSTHETKMINEPIIHVEDLRIERFLSKLNHYTTIQAKEDVARGIRTNLFRILFAFPAMFYKNYIYYGAYKDGHEGVIISVLEGISRTIRHLKIWQLSQTDE